MKYKLSAPEGRVLGCLIEKDLSTPEYYPLSLNALTAACNQKNNRDPVMDMDERQVQLALESLIQQHLAWPRSVPGSRVTKYAHKFSDTLTQTLEFSKPELAVLAELLLRGPQTPGELRTRTPRMYEFATLEQVESVLAGLARREDGPFVVELPRQPGRRESRYMQLFSPSEEAPQVAAASRSAGAGATPSSSGDRLAALESEVAQLKVELGALRDLVTRLRGAD